MTRTTFPQSVVTRLTAEPIAAVGGLVLALRSLAGTLLVQMNVHLGAKRTFCRKRPPITLRNVG